MKISIKLAIGIAATTFNLYANANLLENGSFEDPDLAGNSWAVFDSITGWNTIDGAGIEVQSSTVVAAQDGMQYVELDSHGQDSNSAMAQEVTGLTVDAWYELSFWYQPRTNNGGDDNGINVLWGATDPLDVVNSVSATSSEMNTWNYYSQLVQATGTSMYVGFQAYGLENTLGGFIDNVTLVSVPEPATLGLLALGMLGIGAARRRQSN